MMNLSDLRKGYEKRANVASSIVRQLSLAGIALIWIFKTSDVYGFHLDRPLIQAALFIFIALSFDILQYLVGTTTWFLYFRHKEKSGTTDEDGFDAPAWFNWPTWTLFYLKSISMLVAYLGFILPFLFAKVTVPCGGVLGISVH